MMWNQGQPCTLCNHQVSIEDVGCKYGHHLACGVGGGCVPCEEKKQGRILMADGEKAAAREKVYEWVLLHIRNGEQYMGVVEVPDEFVDKADEPGHEPRGRMLAQAMVGKGFMAELGNAHRIIEVGDGSGKASIIAIPLTYGDRRIFLRGEEVLFVQFLGTDSMLVKQARAAAANLELPTGDARTTASGLVVPGR